ncbi:tRNA A64-2'-O-ribosylphosphate transferase [Biscogniauxia sp. FL1348]|nr:tRNA A64-2'-O-ribosylphosphate transferase [Biscogniauxia sp. FL1348]
MPDALSKTLPIWCCVVNRVLFPELGIGERGEGGEEEVDYHALFTPPTVVSPSEHAQIEARIPAHVAALRALDIDTAALRAHLRKPLRPIWVTPESHLPSPPSPSPSLSTITTPTTTENDGPEGAVQVFDHFHPIICCTSSRRAGSETAGHGHGYGYVQGAGDDTENWALGLTPALFWAHADELLQPELSEAELQRRVRELVVAAAHADTAGGGGGGERQVAPQVRVASLRDVPPEDHQERALAYVCIVPGGSLDPADWARGPRRLELGLGKNAKIAGRNLRGALPRVCEFVRGFFEGSPSSIGVGVGNDGGKPDKDGDTAPGDDDEPAQNDKSVVVACETGRDLSVGVALALLCRCFDAEGRYDGREAAAAAGFTKSLIKLRLGRIMMALPEANPSRTTLQSVNSFLMG